MNSNLPTLTKNNHYIIGYNQKPFSVRQSSADQWFTHYGKCERPILDWRSECLIAAREIQSVANKNIAIALSGGLDSEVVCEAFRNARIPFTAMILRFKNDLNIHDISWAYKYCEDRCIPYRTFEIDIEDFFKGGEALELAKEAHSVIPFLGPQMKIAKLVSSLGYFVVTGAGDFVIKKIENRWSTIEREAFSALSRYAIHNQFSLVRFFKWSPELMLAYLEDSVIQGLVNNKYPERVDNETGKTEMYRNHFLFADRKKYRGYEKVMAIRNHYTTAFYNEFKDSISEIIVSYDKTVAALKQSCFKS